MPPVTASLWVCRYPCLHDQQDSNDSHLTPSVRAQIISCTAHFGAQLLQSNLGKSHFPLKREHVFTVKWAKPVFSSMTPIFTLTRPGEQDGKMASFGHVLIYISGLACTLTHQRPQGKIAPWQNIWLT